jgi:hypothetical protein
MRIGFVLFTFLLFTICANAELFDDAIVLKAVKVSDGAGKDGTVTIEDVSTSDWSSQPVPTEKTVFHAGDNLQFNMYVRFSQIGPTTHDHGVWLAYKMRWASGGWDADITEPGLWRLSLQVPNIPANYFTFTYVCRATQYGVTGVWGPQNGYKFKIIP